MKKPALTLIFAGAIGLSLTAHAAGDAAANGPVRDVVRDVGPDTGNGAPAQTAPAAGAASGAPAVAPPAITPPAATPPARPSAPSAWAFGLVLDATATSRALALGARDKGLQLGHSDLTLSGPLGGLWRAQLTAMAETHEGRLEGSLEEAWLESRALPAGLQLRVGRFASQVGYLNAQHSHADDFTERPLLYRAFLGGHWNDDGLRLNWTAPTPVYWVLGAELFRGKRLVSETASPARSPGVATLVSKWGGDVGPAHSWQLGVAHIRNRREAAVHAEEGEHEDGHEGGHEGEHEADGEHTHSHGHGAQFSGHKTWLLDGVWKWAPGGNNRSQQVRMGFEMARITGLNRHASGADRHEANTLFAVWRFAPSWETGVRSDWLRVSMPHGEHFHSGLLREASLMLAWKPTHQQSLRLQYSAQRDALEFEPAAKRSVQLQYLMSFGAHGAHSY
jgi:hypothetical protein